MTDLEWTVRELAPDEEIPVSDECVESDEEEPEVGDDG
jgi:hypothetical protein